VQVENLTDETKINNFAGQTVQSGQNLFWTQAGRSVFGSLTTTFP